jgi:hypothetical protein
MLAADIMAEQKHPPGPPITLANMRELGVHHPIASRLNDVCRHVESLKSSAPILIKRYARSRLYDTTRVRYVTVEELPQWRQDGVAFQVKDVETGEDVTRVLPHMPLDDTEGSPHSRAA